MTDSVGRDNQNKNSNQEKDRGETRSVAGRNFRKVKGVWTDTAYDGRDTTNLSQVPNSSERLSLMSRRCARSPNNSTDKSSCFGRDAPTAFDNVGELVRSL